MFETGRTVSLQHEAGDHAKHPQHQRQHPQRRATTLCLETFAEIAKQKYRYTSGVNIAVVSPSLWRLVNLRDRVATSTLGNSPRKSPEKLQSMAKEVLYIGDEIQKNNLR